jgi:hypothetical protein
MVSVSWRRKTPGAAAGDAWAVGIAACGAALVGAAVLHWTLGSDVRPALTETARVEPPPLGLMSLGHERGEARLVIHGVVRNPARGPSLTQLTAVVILFVRQGGFLTSGRAQVESIVLAPGSEAPFVVVVSSAAAIGRYRLSFRTAERVVPHLDRRS